MRISIDAMGGDYAPREVVVGTLQAARAMNDIERVYLVGDQSAIEAEMELNKKGGIPPSIEVVHASEVVEMGESPATAVRRKKDSSIARAVDLVKRGEADAILSIGNTGAVVAAATLKMRALEGVSRPAIATIIPAPKGPYVLLDAGANPDSTPEMIQQFAVMGSVYAREIMKVDTPRVGLLSIGSEETKGNENTKRTFVLLGSTSVNFIGNVESRDLFDGKVDVAVCDGFVGNVVLKTSEAVASTMAAWMKQLFKQNLLRMTGYLFSQGVFREMRAKADPSSYGGAPLLGANGVVIIGHGSSNALATFNGIRVASEAIKHNLNHLIEDELRAVIRKN